MDRNTGRLKEIRRCEHTDNHVCLCSCHKQSFRVNHITPCCVLCPECSRMIKTAQFVAWSPTI
jgi:hypothetical protein